MNELVVLALFALGFLGVAPILGIVALVRQGGFGRRLSELQGKLDLLTLRVNSLDRTRAAGPTAARPVAAEPVPQPRSEAMAPPSVETPPDPPRPPIHERPAPAPPTHPPKPPRGSSIDWERWIGLRGAAVLGAVALGLAGLLFFKYSIDHDLITPAMRVVLGTLVGLGCLVGSEIFRRREQPHLSEGLAGAGVVILYAAFWAAHILYSLIPMAAAFALMILVTVACCTIAWRHSAFTVAVIGLVGGFATPLLLSTGTDRPIGLFGYVLLLDLGLLVLGHKRRWPSLVGLSLSGTVLMQALWIGTRMGPDRFPLALIILGVFAALFVVATLLGSAEMQRKWQLSRWAALFFPFAFALYFASRADLGPNLYPIAILLALLCTATSWLSREQGRYEPAFGSAAASLAVIGVWLVRPPLEIAQMWEVVAVLVGLAGLFHLFVERDRERSGWDGPMPAALVSAGGAFLLMLPSMGNVASGFSPWPWIAGFLALAALVYRHAGFPNQSHLQLIAAVCVGFGLLWMHAAHRHWPSFPAPLPYLALMVAVAAVTHVVALRRRKIDTRRWADYAAAAIAVMMLIGVAFDAGLLEGPSPAFGLGILLMLGLLAALAATRLASGWAYAAAVFATWFPQAMWALVHRGSPTEAATALGLATVSVVVLTAWPFLTRARLSTERVAWYASALAGPLWFFPLRGLFEQAFGDGAIGVLPVTLALIAFAALMRSRKLWDPGDPLRLTALAWFAAVALGFVSIAIPLQLEKEWITIGWALEGVAVLALWRRLDHSGLKYFGLALLGAASVRLVLNPALLVYYPRSAVPIFNWLMYTYLVPTAALLGGAAILRALEVARLRGRELELYPKPLPYGAIAASISAVMVVFVWLNLAIADWFSTGRTLTLSFGATPAQRLTVSIAWAVYGLLLLGIGMARGRQGLRWVSLAFLMCTIGKVFLYDLGHLRDLYRVFSLVGLATSLLLVSFLYQRFVFHRGDRAGPVMNTAILGNRILGPVGVMVLAVGGATSAAAGETAELSTLFPNEAQVFAEARGLSCLTLPPEVLAGCKPDLSDLRLFDVRGAEVPFAVDAGAPNTVAELIERFEPRVIEVGRREIRRETGPPLRRETYEIEWPATTPASGAWTLVLDVPHAEFVARVQVEGIAGIARSEALINGSVFRLRRFSRYEKLRLPLPALNADRLRVALESEHPGWLEPRFRLESSRELEGVGRIAVPMRIDSISHENSTTIVTLTRPRGFVPDLLRIDTLTGTFDREVEVRDEGQGRGDRVLGRGKVFRVETWVPVGEREIYLSPATGDRLRVEIDDGDSPALEGLSFEAVVRQPVLIFAFSGGGPLTLRFGGGRAHRPRYDMAGLLPEGRVSGQRARAAAALYDRRLLGAARLGTVRPNPYFDASPALAFAMRPGAEIDRRVFSHVRRVRVPPVPEGLSSIELTPEDLAVLKHDLADLRIADGQSRQWPYLIEPAAIDRPLELAVVGQRSDDGSTRYTLRPPVAPLSIDRLVLDADAPYFDRSFRLMGTFEDGEERPLTTGRLQRPIDDPGPPVSLDVKSARLESLELIVEDGDDAPLTLRSVEARVHTPRLFLTAPEGEYELLLGAPDEKRPRYELERVRQVVLAVQAAAADADPLKENPAYSLRARLGGRGTGQYALMWVALVTAVAVLAIMTLRLARP